MRRVECTVPAGASIHVHAGERSRAFVRGDQVDLDEVLVPPAFTVADALGSHVADHFAPVVDEIEGQDVAAPDADQE